MLCTFVGTHLQFDIILCTLELVCTCTLSVLMTLTLQKCLKMFKNDRKCSQECTSELGSKKQRSRVHTVHTMHFWCILMHFFRSECTNCHEHTTCTLHMHTERYNLCLTLLVYRRRPDWWREIAYAGTKLLYQPAPQPVVYIIPVTEILGRLALTPYGEHGTIPYEWQSLARHYPRGVCDRQDSPGSGSKLYYINSWAMIWPSDHPRNARRQTA